MILSVHLLHLLTGQTERLEGSTIPLRRCAGPLCPSTPLGTCLTSYKFVATTSERQAVLPPKAESSSEFVKRPEGRHRTAQLQSCYYFAPRARVENASNTWGIILPFQDPEATCCISKCQFEREQMGTRWVSGLRRIILSQGRKERQSHHR